MTSSYDVILTYLRQHDVIMDLCFRKDYHRLTIWHWFYVSILITAEVMDKRVKINKTDPELGSGSRSSPKCNGVIPGLTSIYG